MPHAHTKQFINNFDLLQFFFFSGGKVQKAKMYMVLSLRVHWLEKTDFFFMEKVYLLVLAMLACRALICWWLYYRQSVNILILRAPSVADFPVQKPKLCLLSLSFVFCLLSFVFGRITVLPTSKFQLGWKSRACMIVVSSKDETPINNWILH